MCVNSKTNSIKVFTVEPGRWPLLSRRAYPVKIVPKQKGKDEWVFEDYGCNHALPYMLIFVLSLGTVFLTDLLPDSNWGDPGFPIEAKYFLIACGVLLGAYSFFAALISTETVVCVNPTKIMHCHLLFGIIAIVQKNYNCNTASIQVNPVSIAFTRTGLGQSNCFGVFISSEDCAPLKLIACMKSEEDARSYAHETAHSIGVETTESSQLLHGRLSR